MARRLLIWGAAFSLAAGSAGVGATTAAAAAVTSTTVPALSSSARAVTLTPRVLPLTPRVLTLRARVRSIAPKRAKSGTFTVGSDVLFAFDSATLSPDAKAVLASVVASLRKHGAGQVTVNGYTDAIGSASFNLGLSRRRAEAVRGLLAGELPHSLRFRIRGYGKSHPVASNHTAAGRQQNRRVTVSFFG